MNVIGISKSLSFNVAACNRRVHPVEYGNSMGKLDRTSLYSLQLTD